MGGNLSRSDAGAQSVRERRGVRRSRVVLAPRAWRLSAPARAGVATVTKNAAHRGEHEVSRKTIARGKSGCLGCTCLIRVRFFLPLHTVLRAQSAPGFPCALSKGEEQRDCTNSGENASRERAHMFPRHCERSEAIQLPRKRKLDCFVAPLLAMTVDGLFDR